MIANRFFRIYFPLLVTSLIAASYMPAQATSRLTPLSPIVPNHYLVAYRNGTIPPDAAARTSLAGAHVLQQHERLGIAVVETNGTADDATNLQRLAAQPDVDFVVHDRMVYAHQVTTAPAGGYHNPIARPLAPVAAQINAPIPPVNTPLPPVIVPVPPVIVPLPPIIVPVPPAPIAPDPADSFYTTPEGWAVRQVGGYGKNIPGGPAHGPWDITMGRGVRIAILDSGIDAAHPDIAPNLVFNLSEVDQTPQTGLPSPCDDGSPQDQQGHGTWTASLAAGAAGSGTGLIIGVAPEASIVNIKVLERMPNVSVTGSAAQQCSTGEASGLMSWVLKGINDAMTQHADVISFSLGSMVDISTGDGAGLKSLVDRATYAAAQAGAVLIAAAGNDGFNFINSRYIELPAQARNVLAIVAATNPACAENLTSEAVCVAGPVMLPYYSNFGATAQRACRAGWKRSSGR